MTRKHEPWRTRDDPEAGVLDGVAPEDQHDTTGFDPTDPWKITEGGPTVIEADTQEHHHDPGPGVIGIDR